VNAWSIAAVVLVLGLIPCAVVCLRERIVDAVIALQVANALTASVLLVMAVAAERSPYADVALVFAVLALPSGLVFVRFLERWG
jgi:multisubunit Na+/H+ antiporter MnhF subunit